MTAGVPRLMPAGIPQPLAALGVVSIDSAERVLIVKPAEVRGHVPLLWRQGHAVLVKDEARGGFGNVPTPWAAGAGRRQIARGEPGEGGALRFRFHRGDPVYRELVSQPGLRAIVTVDKGGYILGVKFAGRRGD